MKDLSKKIENFVFYCMFSVYDKSQAAGDNLRH